MFARVMSTNLKKETIDEAVSEWRTHIEPFKPTGLEKAYMFVDRAPGKYLWITLGESEAAQEPAMGGDCGVAFDRVDDLRQHLSRAAPVVDRETAMIGDVDDVDAVLDGEPCVVCRRHTF